MNRGLRNGLKSIVPNWLSDRPGLNVGFKFLYVFALMADLLVEMALEGVRAAWPGKGTPTALPLLAESRGLLQGPNESNASFIGRLIAWLTTWSNAGGAATMAQQIQTYLIGQGNLGAGVLPVVRIVDRSGNWTIANTDGTVTKTTGAFNWDQVLGADDGTVNAIGANYGHQTGTTVTAWWSDVWVIIAPPTGSTPVYTRYTGTNDPAWIANFGPAATLGGGMQIPLAVSAGILRIVSAWKGAHTYVRAIIWPLDSTSWTPATPTADGTMGDWSYNSSGTQVPARPIAARFMIPTGGA